jgi:hypothetical protein
VENNWKADGENVDYGSDYNHGEDAPRNQ